MTGGEDPGGVWMGGRERGVARRRLGAGRGTEPGTGSTEMDKESRCPRRPAVYTSAPGPFACGVPPCPIANLTGTPAPASLPFLLLCQPGFLGGVLVLDKFHPLLAQQGLEVPVLVWRQRRKGKCTGSDPWLCFLALPFPLDGSVSSALLWGPCVLLESWFPLLFPKYSRPPCQPLSGASPPPLPCSPRSGASTAIPGGGNEFRGGGRE